MGHPVLDKVPLVTYIRMHAKRPTNYRTNYMIVDIAISGQEPYECMCRAYVKRPTN